MKDFLFSLVARALGVKVVGLTDTADGKLVEGEYVEIQFSANETYTIQGFNLLV